MLRRVWRRNGNGSWCATICVLCSLALFVHLFMSVANNFSVNEKESLDARVSDIRERMDHLGLLDKEKSKAFVELQNQLQYLLKDFTGDRKSIDGNRPRFGPDKPEKRDLEREKQAAAAIAHSFTNAAPSWLIPSASSNFSGPSVNQTLTELHKNGLVADLSLITTDLAVPNIYDHLPHLLENPKALLPAVRISKNRRHVQMTIGVPTTKRPKISYLVTTLRSLIDNLSEAEKNEVLIVVFIAESDGLTEFITEQVVTLYNEFRTAIDRGLLEILVPSGAYYPNMDEIPATFDDPPERMKWRTKQNLDYSYLMMYCQNRATYYLQVEDDVITKPAYFEKMKEFIRKQADAKWYLLEFSSLGFIGKLFRSSDLPQMVNFLLMFYKEKPVDWLLDHIFYVRLCHPEKSAKQCQQAKNQFRLRYKPSLFQHIGVHSSLKGKVQKLKERDFGKQPMHKAHTDNPPAEITTSLKTYQKFTLEAAYKGETFFWGLLPQPGDWVKFTFTPPIRLESFTFRSGNAEHPDDMFYNTSVEILPSTENEESLVSGSGNFPKTDDNYFVVSWFRSTGAAECGLNTTGTVKALRLVVHSESVTWVILNEIWIRTLKDS